MTNAATLTKTQEAPPVGKYIPTSVDASKVSVDFRVIQMSPVVILWNDGKRETVKSNRLAELQKAFSWKTDF